MKKVLAMILALVMALSLVACSNGGTDKPDDNTETKKIKVGFITLHDENSTYDLNFINAAKEACQTLGLVENEDYFIKKNVPEGQECYNAAAELAEQGCNIIFADSFGHESFMIEAAKEFPNVQFCHSTGVRAHTEGLSNYHNAFASIYEGRYLAGIAAGLKLNQMIAEGKITADKAKMGYVGAFTYAEVISGYTSFFLGARSVCPTATMEVTFTGSWYDETAEKEGAEKLIQNGCVLISQHADSMGAPTACEKAGVPNVSYNGSTVSVGPNTYIISSRIDWAPYYVYAIQAAMDGKTIDVVWNGMTLTDEVTSSMACSNAYCNNAQVVILPADKAADYGTVDSLSGLRFAVDSGSAGMAQAEEKGLTYTDVVDQATALLEVKSGTADAAIIASLMAGAMVGEGTNYADLAIGPVLNAETGEQYGVGFRKGSDAAAALNEFFRQQWESGALQTLAEQYGVQAALIEQKEF